MSASFLRRMLGNSSGIGGALIQKLGIALSSDYSDDASAPIISAGSGAPDDSDGAPDGSVWLRNDGTSATTLYAKASSAYSAVSADASDFGDAGIQTDVVAESTSAAGVTVDSVLLKDGSVTVGTGGSVSTDTIAEKTSAAGVTIDSCLIKDGQVQGTQVADPGNAGAIPVTRSGSVAIVTAGAETRTLAIPAAVGQTLSVYMQTDGGDCVITVASAINQAGNNTVTLNDVGDCVTLRGIYTGAAMAWRVLANDGASLSTV